MRGRRRQTPLCHALPNPKCRASPRWSASRRRIERPVAAHCRAALAGLPPADQRLVAFEFTKRDRQVVGDPLVSILIPAYSPRFFGACLDSALAQTYGNIEIVVCDDSEDSEIEEIVRARGDRRPIRYATNPVRLGVRGQLSEVLRERARRVRQVPLRRRPAGADLRGATSRRVSAGARRHARHLASAAHRRGRTPPPRSARHRADRRTRRADRRAHARQRDADGRAQRDRRAEHDPVPQRPTCWTWRPTISASTASRGTASSTW